MWFVSDCRWSLLIPHSGNTWRPSLCFLVTNRLPVFQPVSFCRLQGFWGSVVLDFYVHPSSPLWSLSDGFSGCFVVALHPIYHPSLHLGMTLRSSSAHYFGSVIFYLFVIFCYLFIMRFISGWFFVRAHPICGASSCAASCGVGWRARVNREAFLSFTFSSWCLIGTYFWCLLSVLVYVVSGTGLWLLHCFSVVFGFLWTPKIVFWSLLVVLCLV